MDGGGTTIAATSWSEVSQSVVTGWIADVYGPDFSGEFIVIGDAVVPATEDGTPATSAATSTPTWTEASQAATTFTEQSQAATSWTEVEG